MNKMFDTYVVYFEQDGSKRIFPPITVEAMSIVDAACFAQYRVCKENSLEPTDYNVVGIIRKGVKLQTK